MDLRETGYKVMNKTGLTQDHVKLWAFVLVMLNFCILVCSLRASGCVSRNDCPMQRLYRSNENYVLQVH
jgi:hypothetical protein